MYANLHVHTEIFRTFMESEVKNPVLRKDLYEKMVKLCPVAPTPEEREQQAITKLRYMQFREEESSTAEYGFRIEALRVGSQQFQGRVGFNSWVWLQNKALWVSS